MKYLLTPNNPIYRAKRESQFKTIANLDAQEIDRRFHEGDEQAFQKIDCLECANCCKNHSPILEQDDLEKLAKVLALSVGVFIQQYVEMDEEGDFVFRKQPCPLLQTDNSCSVYNDRPKACREYPHTQKSGMKEILDITLENSFVCPAVDHIIKVWGDL